MTDDTTENTEAERVAESLKKQQQRAKENLGAEVEAEILPTLAELRQRIAACCKPEHRMDDDWEREDWHPLLVAIHEAGLKPGDKAAAIKALLKHFELERKVINDELKLLNSEVEDDEQDEKSIAQSEKLMSWMITMFGSKFSLPISELGGKLWLGTFDGRPWIISKEGGPLCTPFVFDGSVDYPDQDHDLGVRVRIFDQSNKVVSAVFDASLLGKTSGNEVISALRAKGWAFMPNGREFMLAYLNATQKPGPTVYHQPGLKGDVFVLASDDIIAVDEDRKNGIELHPNSKLKGRTRPEVGSLDGWRSGAQPVFKNPKAWHFQVGILLGWYGPTIGYLGLESMMAWLGGDTREGKTTLEQLAAGHYAVPDVVNYTGYILRAKGTFGAQEHALQMGSGAVLCLDEVGKIPPKEQAELPFLVWGGGGKRKQTKDSTAKATIKWASLCVIASAEKTLGNILAVANENFDAGMTARLLPIALANLVRFSDESDEWKGVRGMLKNYGYSGPGYIQALFKHDPRKLEKRLEEIVDSLPLTKGEGSSLRRSAARLVAFIPLVAEIARKEKLIPEDYDPMPLARKLWEEFRESDTPPIYPAERALVTLCENLVLKKGSDVVAFDDRDKPRSREAMAFHSVPLNGKLAYVIPTGKIGVLSGNIANPDSLKRLLKEQGYLKIPQGKRAKGAFTWTGFKGLGAKLPCIVLDAEKVDGVANDFDHAPDGTQEDAVGNSNAQPADGTGEVETASWEEAVLHWIRLHEASARQGVTGNPIP